MAIRGHHVHEPNALANAIDKIVDRNYNDINDSLKVTVTNGGGLDTVISCYTGKCLFCTIVCVSYFVNKISAK